MKKVTIPDRLLFLAAIVSASYLIVKGFAGFAGTETALLTIAMGVLVIAGLLLLIFGFEILENKAVVVVATITPLSLSTALIFTYLPRISLLYSLFSALGFLLILFTRFSAGSKTAAMVLAPVHGIAGMIIFILPIVIYIQGKTTAQFTLVGAGGVLMGLAGLMLAFLKAGKPILSREIIFRIFPSLLLLTTLAFVIGFIGK